MTDTTARDASSTDTAVVGTARGAVVERRPGMAERDPKRHQRRRRIVDNILRIGTPILIVVLWQILATVEVIDRRFWPGPWDVAKAFRDLIEKGDLQEAIGASLGRLLWGFFFGSLSGIVVGLVLGVSRHLRTALEPVVSAFYTVPKLALLPPLLLLFGLGDKPKIILIAMSVFFIVVIGTTSATTRIPNGYIEPSRAFSAGRFATFRHVIVPAVIPEVFVALRIAAGTAVLMLVGIEFVQGSDGLGYMIWNSWQVYRVAIMYVGIVTVAILGVAFQSIILWIGRRIAPWSTTADFSGGQS